MICCVSWGIECSFCSKSVNIRFVSYFEQQMPNKKKHNNRQAKDKVYIITRTILCAMWVQHKSSLQFYLFCCFWTFSLVGFLMTLQSAVSRLRSLVEKYLLFIGLVQCLPFGPFFLLIFYYILQPLLADNSLSLRFCSFLFYSCLDCVLYWTERIPFMHSLVCLRSNLFCPLLSFGC